MQLAKINVIDRVSTGFKTAKKRRVKPIFHCDAKPFAFGSWRWLRPPMPQFCVGGTNMLVSKNSKICVTPTQKVKFALPPTPTPNASRWNIDGVGSPTQNSRVGHVDFMLFGSISFALGSQREPSIQWNMGLTTPVNIHCRSTKSHN